MDGYPFEPESPVWSYTDNFHTQMQGGAFRLPNGNTLITDCDDAHMFEVTSDGNVVWDFDYGGGQTMIARAQKYPPEFFDGSQGGELTGDINEDGIVNILDIILLVNVVLGLSEASPASDVNEDGILNILDIVNLVNIVLGT